MQKKMKSESTTSETQKIAKPVEKVIAKELEQKKEVPTSPVQQKPPALKKSPRIDVMMTTYDRVGILSECVKSYCDATLKPPRVFVFDDQSHDRAAVESLIAKMPGSKLVVREKQLGLYGNSAYSLKEMFTEHCSEAVFILDSDTILHKDWWAKLNSIYKELKDDEDFGSLSLFNPGQDKMEKSHRDPSIVEKTCLIGVGRLVTRSDWENGILPLEKIGYAAWDNKSSKALLKAGKKLYATSPSFAQHAGVYDGNHIGRISNTYAVDFLGTDDVQSKIDEISSSVNMVPAPAVVAPSPTPAARIDRVGKGKSVLFSVYSHFGDIIMGSFLVNMLRTLGYSVTWLTSPYYHELVLHLFPEKKSIKTDEAIPSKETEWSHISAREMAVRYPGYSYYLNAQPESPEHENRLLASPMSTIEYMVRHIEESIGEKLPPVWAAYKSPGQDADVVVDFRESDKPLMIVNPDLASENTAFTEDLVKEIIEKNSQSYDVKVLVDSRPDNRSFREIRGTYIYGMTLAQRFEVVRQASAYVGNRFGLVYAALGSAGKKAIYHSELTGRNKCDLFGPIDKKAQDIVLAEPGGAVLASSASTGFGEQRSRLSGEAFAAKVAALTAPKWSIGTDGEVAVLAKTAVPEWKSESSGESGVALAKKIRDIEQASPKASAFPAPKRNAPTLSYDSGGQLGNRLFQYVLARLLANRIGFRLYPQYEYNDTITATQINEGEPHSIERVTIIESLETGNMLANKYEQKNLHLQGYWQEAEYYLDNREEVLSFFNEKAPTVLDKDNIVMHVRLNDYKKFGVNGTVIDPKYYHDCLKREKFDNLFIVTDAPDDDYFREFDYLNPIFNQGSEREDFWYMTEFDRIIMGNSTFSWWAAFMSNASVIYSPECWIRNSGDINHSLQNVSNGKTTAILVPAGFKEYFKGEAV